MKKSIYKITNKINGKSYIGQSSRPEQRFREHCYKKEHYTNLIGRAIAKYGVDNFSFDILGEYKDYNEKEKEFIKKYNTLDPNGYNLMEGGEEPPTWRGEDHPNARITEESAGNVVPLR